VVPGNNQIADPRFVDGPSRNLHLQAGSPAIDAAIPSPGLIPEVDFDGTMRPQGAQLDVGAFERAP
jgi:hypothetical protein